MPTTQALAVKKLTLDTENFRTIVQPNELAAVQALIAIDPDWFWALMESLLDDGYLPTENIIVLEQSKKFIVKEGNRRIAALKLIHEIVPRTDVDLPTVLEEKIAALSKAWLKTNAEVPCTVYNATEAKTVDRIVTLTHGKGDLAGRLRWNSVARARHNRHFGATEHALDLLEKFLAEGKKRTPEQAQRWAGEYNLSVLDEATKKLAERLGVKTSPEVSKAYPKVKNRAGLDALMVDIGLELVKFSHVRAEKFGINYGFPSPAQDTSAAKGGTTSGGGAGSTSGAQQSSSGGATSAGSSTSSGSGSSGSTNTKSSTHNARTIDDPRAVKKLLRGLKIKGKGREKVATLVSELIDIDLKKTPNAFCFVLRSTFEVSAKIFFDDHAGTPGAPKITRPDGKEKTLAVQLKDIVNYLTNNKADKEVLKALHGASAELLKEEGLLSFTSMNQLVHNRRFSIAPPDICILFSNVFPLLEAINK